MLSSYFRSSLRFLAKNKLYAIINLVGLAISLTACLLIAVYVQGELSYDQHWQDADRIYRANLVTLRSGRPPQSYPASSEVMLPAMWQFFSDDIVRGSRIYRAGPQEIMVDNERYEDPVHFAEPDLLDMFQFEVLTGSLENAFRDINSIALDEASALRYFGNTDVIGSTVSAVLPGGELEDYQVVAVYRLAAGNTVLELPNLALYDQAKISRVPNFFESWLRLSVQTFIQLSPGTDAAMMQSQMHTLLDQHASLPAGRLEAGQTPGDVLDIQLQRLSDIYFNPTPFIGLDETSGNRTMVLVFAAISVLVVLIGCINFIILATALTSKRSMDVSIRRILGARPDQLMGQYLGESLIITFIAFVIALLCVELLLPSLETAVGKSLSISYSDSSTWLALFVLFVTVGLLGSLYPAFVLSMTSPLRILKSKQSRKAMGLFSLRNSLVVFQFAISIALIIVTVSIYGQLRYTSTIDPGFNSDNLLIVERFGRNEIAANRDAFKQELLALPDAVSAAYSAAKPNSGLGLILDYNAVDGASRSQDLAMMTLAIGFGFFETYQMSLVAGRFPERDRDPEQDMLFILDVSGQEIDESTVQPARILINETAATQLGFANPEDAVGRIIESGDRGEAGYQELLILGVVADNQYRSLRVRSEPEVYYLYEDRTNFLTLRFEGDGQAMQEQVAGAWSRIMGDQPMVSGFANQELVNTFQQERNAGDVLVAFALLSLAVTCLGLFGIAAFIVDSRARETGLRKVLGAETHHIIGLLLWQFSKPVLLANLIAWPIAIYAMVSWLERFPYQFDRWLFIPLCLAAGFAALAIAWSTVIIETRKVATASPIQFLRYE